MGLFAWMHTMGPLPPPILVGSGSTGRTALPAPLSHMTPRGWHGFRGFAWGRKGGSCGFTLCDEKVTPIPILALGVPLLECV